MPKENKNKNIVKIDVNELNLWYSDNHALHGISVPLYENKITALIGPSGCGKSTFLRCLNRMNDLISSVKIDGSVVIDKKNIYDKDVDEVSVRKKIGKIIKAPFFLSTTKDKDWGNSEVVLKINTSVNSLGKDLSEIGINSSEKEVLFKTNSLFKIIAG